MLTDEASTGRTLVFVIFIVFKVNSVLVEGTRSGLSVPVASMELGSSSHPAGVCALEAALQGIEK